MYIPYEEDNHAEQQAHSYGPDIAWIGDTNLGEK
jgi:hypothetical protein